MKSPEPARRNNLLDGVTLSELKAIFGMQDAEVKKLLLSAKVKSVGIREGRYQVYNIREAIKAIHVPDMENHEELIHQLMKMTPEKLPQRLQKAYWDGQISRQTYEKRAADLWETDKVVEIASDSFKILRLSLLLMPDTVAREAGLSETQRVVVQRLVDNTLNDLQKRLQDAFENRRDGAIGEPDAPGQDDPAADL